MKEILQRILRKIESLEEKIFDIKNKKIVLKCIPHALSEIISVAPARITKEALLRTLMIRCRLQFSDRQYEYLMRALPAELQRHGYHLVVNHDEIMILNRRK